MNYHIVFCGTGMIGAGLAANAMLKGNKVTLYDVVPESKIEANLKNVLDILIEAEAAEAADVEKKLKEVRICTDLKEALAEGADMVQECIPERMDLKKDLFRTVQETLGEDVIICSSTSMMMPSDLQEGALYPGKIVVGHPYNPSYLLPLIEICGPKADPETIEKAKAIYTAMGKMPIVCRKEVKGFLVNNVSWQVLYAGIDSFRNDMGDAEDIDKALVFGPGMRMAVLGQLLTIGLGIEGGFAKAPEKYGIPADEVYDRIGVSLDEEIANRKPDQGQTPEDVIKWRDKAFAAILKIHGLL